DLELIADGADSTRVVLRVTDEFGAIRPYANDPIKLTLEGPAEIIGDNPFALVGGTGAIWIRANEQPANEQPANEQPGNEQLGTGQPGTEHPGTVRLTATHPRLGTQVVRFILHPADKSSYEI
ncbi:MAG: hypothetical protein WBX38_15655, partial [Candidatus Sulfotelmatobacter sp.]